MGVGAGAGKGVQDFSTLYVAMTNGVSEHIENLFDFIFKGGKHLLGNASKR